MSSPFHAQEAAEKLFKDPGSTNLVKEQGGDFMQTTSWMPHPPPWPGNVLPCKDAFCDTPHLTRSPASAA
jgi:hypothetical protein